ncbi:hypothetical protein B0T21DRAFT_347066 [Apiosordaria backusii]|uniref:Uncharacterized protein n=1 Tax=Apiosordaria backusii TaxID=314023 RepID=A0AA40BSZ3_9PEZI|nr:hypothetical protein B0T21DRAFT_347066 [Apiosordaria backusii]
MLEKLKEPDRGTYRPGSSAYLTDLHDRRPGNTIVAACSMPLWFFAPLLGVGCMTSAVVLEGLLRRRDSRAKNVDDGNTWTFCGIPYDMGLLKIRGKGLKETRKRRPRGEPPVTWTEYRSRVKMVKRDKEKCPYLPFEAQVVTEGDTEKGTKDRVSMRGGAGKVGDLELD